MVLRSFRCLSLLLATISVGVGAAIVRVDAQTEPARQISIVQEMAPVGLAFGQTLRYTLANTNQPGTEPPVFEPLRVTVRLLAEDGGVLAQASAEAAKPGGFAFVEFARPEVARSGDPITGRLQLRTEITIAGRTKYPDIVLKRGITSGFHHAVELVDDITGRTSVSMGGGLNELSTDDTPGNFGKPEGFQIISAGRDGLLGVVPGQELRLSASNPLTVEDGRQGKMLFAFTVLDLDGSVIAQGDEITVEPGQSHSFDVPYSELAVADPEITGRVQVRTEMRRFFPGIVNRIGAGVTDSPPASLELVDSASGRTVMLLSSKPKEIVVVGR